MTTLIIGWASSVVLIATIVSQLHRQWRVGSVKGVSPLLFIGQGCASFGLMIYSTLRADWVFVVLNAVMVAAAITGGVMWCKLRPTSS